VLQRTRTAAFAIVVVVGIVGALAGCADDAPGPAGPDAEGAGAGAAAAAGTSDGALQPGATVEFVATEFAFSPSELVAQPGSYHGVLVNDGQVTHDITIGDAQPVVADPGQSVEFDFEVVEGGVTIRCSIPGHEDAGMHGTIATPGAAVATEATAGDQTADGGHGGGQIAAGAVEPDPEAPEYQLRDPSVPARGEGEGVTLVPGGAPGGGDLIDVEMVIEEQQMTVASGYVQQVWTFNGQLPGPVLRTQVGDTVRVHLVNPADSQLSHSIDFHASQVAWNDEMRSIAPGEELIYEFTTDYAGVWMYHCGTAPVLHHIANGMFGMVIVEPEGGLPPVDHEFFLVQNEWYLGEQGAVSSLAKADQAAPAPDLVMFNGVAQQYLNNPIEVDTGADVRLFVLDVGPSIDSSFHVVGTIFHSVTKEGVQLAEGNDGSWGSQAVDLAPAQGAVIEFRAMEDGLYPFVTHAFNFPGRGAVGLFQAGDGEP
jgi:nitrite reductase (NO-forming)